MKLKFLLIAITILGFNGAVFAQSIASLNFNYIYNPNHEVILGMKVVKDKQQVTVYFEFQANSSQYPLETYDLKWERRESYTAKEGVPLEQKEEIIPTSDSSKIRGKFTFPAPTKQWLLLAKVTNSATMKSWSYFQTIEPKYPVNGFVESKSGFVSKPYLLALNDYTIQGNGKPLNVDFYKTNFPVSSPPFAEKEAKADRFMFPDSTFIVESGQKISILKEGLYLVQEDTTLAEGFAFRAVNGVFPKFVKVEDLVAPLIFVCTKDEHGELIAAKGDKVKFDKVILDITRDRDRAKNFMRSYFRRVELTNLYFSSYKEGWKTDRGMIFLIFGLPDEVSRNGQNEVWYYKNYRTRFTFVKTGSIYDPSQFTLIRNTNYMETWFNTIDLWRKSRF
jgi:GWxTD domain-containing protein